MQNEPRLLRSALVTFPEYHIFFSMSCYKRSRASIFARFCASFFGDELLPVSQSNVSHNLVYSKKYYYFDAYFQCFLSPILSNKSTLEH